MKIAAVLAAATLVVASCADSDTADTTAVETTEAAVESTEAPADSEPATDAETASPVATVDAWLNRIAPNITPVDDHTAAEWRAWPKRP